MAMEFDADPSARLAHGLRAGVAAIGAVLTAACVSLQMSPATLAAAEGGEVARTLERDVELKFDTGYTRTLRSGTRIVFAGTLPQGKVYRFVDAVLTVEGTHMHEAWVVVDGDRLVGYYLPVEKAFVAQGSAPTLYLKR